MNGALASWCREPTPVGEETWTPWGEGWYAWSSPSPEVEFCEFVGALVRLLRPRLVVETGVGAGYVTRRIIAGLGSGSWIGFESDDGYRAEGRRLPWPEDLTLSSEVSPASADMAAADLVVLDSAPEYRLTEFDLWREHGKPSSVLVCHDVSSRHQPSPRNSKVHIPFYNHISTSGLTGVFLTNPRGAWMGQHP